MKWWDILKHPLGLVGFALALVFGVIGAKMKDRQEPWFLPVAIGLAALAILGGLFLADKQINKSSINSQDNIIHKTDGLNSPVIQENIKIIQNTEGANSQAIQGNKGNITIIQNPKGSTK